MEGYIAAIFDLDGTLIDYETASHEALKRPLAKVGKADEFTWELHGEIVGTTAKDWATHILASLQVDASVYSIEDYIKDYHVTMEEYYSSIPKIEGAVNVIKAIAALGHPVAIATSSQRYSFDVKMKYHPEILEHVSIIVTGDEVTNGKPAPDIFQLAAERLGVDAKKAVVFEDSPHGITGAKAAGCLAVALPDQRFPKNKSKFESADVVLEGFPAFDVAAWFAPSPTK